MTDLEKAKAALEKAVVCRDLAEANWKKYVYEWAKADLAKADRDKAIANLENAYAAYEAAKQKEGT